MGGTKRHPNKAFTLMEILVVLVISIVGIGLFHRVFVVNWNAYQNRITQADLWQESNAIVEAITLDGRSARRVNIVDGGTAKEAQLMDIDDNLIATYRMENNGDFEVQKDGGVRTFSRNLDFINSSFTETGGALRLDLALQQETFIYPIKVITSVEIYPRNVSNAPNESE